MDEAASAKTGRYATSCCLGDEIGAGCPSLNRSDVADLSEPRLRRFSIIRRSSASCASSILSTKCLKRITAPVYPASALNWEKNHQTKSQMEMTSNLRITCESNFNLIVFSQEKFTSSCPCRGASQIPEDSPVNPDDPPCGRYSLLTAPPPL